MEVIVMGSDIVNWEAALAQLDAQIVKLQAAREGILLMASQGGFQIGPGGGGGSSATPTSVEPGAFHGKSIPEAAKSYLQIAKKKQSTQEIIDALESGGLPRYKYSTVYAVLSRRQSKVGDIVNENGDWRLKEWAPHYRKTTTKIEEDQGEQLETEKVEKKSA